MENIVQNRMPLIGDTAPSFKAVTTQGEINFPEDFRGKWVILFSHPADFTPVCTTEFMTFASMAEEFKAMNTELVGLSVDSLYSHIAWLRKIQDLEWNGMKGVEVKGLPMRYPQGAEKTLVETCTGREVPQVGPSGKPGLPADVGCVIMNVTSVSTLGKFLKTGIPLVTKRVTVEGDAIARPQNIEVPIGTLYRDVIDACGGVKEGVELGKIIFGGPMMGGAAPSADFPVLKQNNGLLLFSKKAAALPEPSACIRCGRCIEACPMGLEPVVIAQDFANKDFAALKARCVDLCVACGSCTYACPAKRPVSQTMGLAKGWYMAELRKGGK